ncbi:hypothetical protein OY671_007848, partial [Metschnikowia pulcherrima]
RRGRRHHIAHRPFDVDAAFDVVSPQHADGALGQVGQRGLVMRHEPHPGIRRPDHGAIGQHQSDSDGQGSELAFHNRQQRTHSISSGIRTDTDRLPLAVHMPPTLSSRAASPGWLILMGASTAIGPFAIDMYSPAFPTIAANSGVPRGDVERTSAAYSIGSASAQVFYGPMADRFGRKPPSSVGSTLFMIASSGCASAGSVEASTGWRVVQAMGGAAGIVIPRAVIRDHYETHEAARAMSSSMSIMGSAPILAPSAGGQSSGIASWRSSFWVMSAGGAMSMTAVVLIMKESSTPERVVPSRWQTIVQNYRASFAHRGFMAHSSAGGFGQAGMFA